MSEFHVGLLVRDTPTLIGFYQDLFGVVPKVIIKNEYIEFPLSHNLIVDVEASKLVKDDIGEMDDKFYLRLEVGDIEKLYTKCKQEHIEVVAAPIKKDYGKIEMFLRDPEGNLIQCFQKIE